MRRPIHAAESTGRSGFTFAEVLAAMLFMAILVPVVCHTLALSNRISVLAERKAVALQVAENQLYEAILTGDWALGSSSGDVDADGSTYQWELATLDWAEDDLVEVTVGVSFEVQGREYLLHLTSLADDNL